jgi:MoxR-like ATPase
MRIIKLNAIDSTNSFLKEMIGKEEVTDYTIVVAEHQTNGRGQMGAVWDSDKGKNLMFVGPAGTGKTQIVFKASEALGKQIFYFNLGSTQDVRSALIGNTYFKDGTYFEESAFVKAIKSPNTVILLDELSRANPEAWNILMPVLDANIRKLRLDESTNSPVVDVADGVSFIATANVGYEYSSTRALDRALVDRFSVVEMDVLNKDQEMKLLSMSNPYLFLRKKILPQFLGKI